MELLALIVSMCVGSTNVQVCQKNFANCYLKEKEADSKKQAACLDRAIKSKDTDVCDPKDANPRTVDVILMKCRAVQ